MGLVYLGLAAWPVAAQGATAGSSLAPRVVLAPESLATATDEEDAGAEDDDGEHGHGSRLSDLALPLQLDGFPQRPKPILELGENFLGTGTLRPGLKLPTGAIWQPSFLLFGQLRSAVQLFENGDGQVSEVATRLDLFGNLKLSGSERLVIGFRTLDQDGRFTSYVIDSDVPGVEEGFSEELNFDVTSLFFEGDFGEIFPNLSRKDFSPTDWGFAVGRQPLRFQEGLLINDIVDAIGITRNTLMPRGTSNFRSTFLFAWNNIDRVDSAQGGAVEDDDANLVGVLTSTDLRKSTVDIDAVWLPASGASDALFLGASAVQRLGRFATSFFAAGSSALGAENGRITNGAVVLSEVSWVPHGRHDHPYFTVFVAAGDYRSAVRDPLSGGPLGRAGINFAAVGLGNYGAALSSEARDVVGGAFGYQLFQRGTRRQLLLEAGTRLGTADDVADEIAATARYQFAMKQRFVLVLDGFVGRRGPSSAAEGRNLYGSRVELVIKF